MRWVGVRGQCLRRSENHKYDRDKNRGCKRAKERENKTKQKQTKCELSAAFCFTRFPREWIPISMKMIMIDKEKRSK